MKTQKRLKRLTWFCISAVICCATLGCATEGENYNLIKSKYKEVRMIGFDMWTAKDKDNKIHYIETRCFFDPVEITKDIIVYE